MSWAHRGPAFVSDATKLWVANPQLSMDEARLALV